MEGGALWMLEEMPLNSL